MQDELDPHQTEALTQALGGRDVEVSERDFRRPRRFSAKVREGLRRRVEVVLPHVEKAVNGLLDGEHTLQLDHVRETSAEGLFDDHEAPLAALSFEVDGDPGWLLWESQAAAGCVEAILGFPSENPQARALSIVEVKILEQVLVPLAMELAGALDRKLERPRVVQSPDGLGSWRDGKRLDAHRIELALGLMGEGGTPSSLRLFLPGVKPTAAENMDEDLQSLPGHLDNVAVDVCAQLMGCEVSLDQLLALEEGDVIPIESRVGDPALLTVEGLILARAAMGQHRGQLAVRIEKLENQVEEIP